VFEIGNSLREARLRKELDFPELEQGTKIRAKYLRALEDENFDQLPAPTYVKGFLRTYADYLGLDGQLYVDEYNVRYASGDEVLERRIRGGTAPSRRPRPRQRRLESRIVWLALAGIAALTALVIAAWRFGGSDNPALPLARTTASPSTHAATGLQIRAVKGNSLVIVRAGSASGVQRYQGTLEKGEVMRRPVEHGLWVYIGSPENVAMKLNGRSVIVGGSKPRSLIVTAGNIEPAGPGT
jgi:hypothetical protein